MKNSTIFKKFISIIFSFFRCNIIKIFSAWRIKCRKNIIYFWGYWKENIHDDFNEEKSKYYKSWEIFFTESSNIYKTLKFYFVKIDEKTKEKYFYENNFKYFLSKKWIYKKLSDWTFTIYSLIPFISKNEKWRKNLFF